MKEKSNSDDEENLLNQILIETTRKLIEGRSKEKIVEELVEQGMSAESASYLANHTAQLIEDYKNSTEGRQTMVTTAKKRMSYGLPWLIGSTAVTIISYSARP